MDGTNVLRSDAWMMATLYLVSHLSRQMLDMKRANALKRPRGQQKRPNAKLIVPCNGGGYDLTGGRGTNLSDSRRKACPPRQLKRQSAASVQTILLAARRTSVVSDPEIVHVSFCWQRTCTTL